MIYVGNSGGCVGRCDAKCYDAKEPGCDCICGGLNHGVGLQVALDNTAELVDPTGELRTRMSDGRRPRRGAARAVALRGQVFSASRACVSWR